MTKNSAKTKILATIGPATGTKRQLSKLVDAGVDAFRLNFSHGTHEEFYDLFHHIHRVREDKSLPIPTLADLQGPKIRVGELERPEIKLKTGNKIKITTQSIFGNEDIIPTSYKDLIKDAGKGDKILIDDGLIHLEVFKKSNDQLICEITEGGILKPRKGMNLPGMKLSTPSITKKDYKDLQFALENNIDFAALSFVRTPDDIRKLKKWMKSKGYNKPVIAKIEKKEAVDNFDGILKEADGIMVARGDLGVEMPPQDVPVIQKNIIGECNAVGKLVITATQMLESMINHPVPTRAEASDIANAVWDGTDVVMLSGETSIGSYPIEAVKIMNKILMTTENQRSYSFHTEYIVPDSLVDNLFDSLGKSVTTISEQVNAALIVVFTHYGRKAKVISKFRPDAPIIAISDEFPTLNYLNMQWGITPYFMKDFDDEDEAIKKATGIISGASLVQKGDVVIFTSGAPYTDKGRKSWLRFVVI